MMTASDRGGGGNQFMDDEATPGLLEAVRRYKWLVLGITLVTMAVAGGVSYLLGHKALATGTLGLAQPSTINVLAPGIAGDAALARYTSQRAMYATSDEVLEDAAKSLGDISRQALQKVVTVTPSSSATTMDVSATADTPARAVAIVSAVMESYQRETAAQVLQLTGARLNVLDQRIATLQSQMQAEPKNALQVNSTGQAIAALRQAQANLSADSAAFGKNGTGVEFVQMPDSTTVVTHKIPYTDLLIGALVGLALGCTVAWLLADKRRLVTAPTGAEHVLGTRFLGEVVDLRHPVRSGRDRTVLSRNCREILLPLVSPGSPKVLLVTGAARGAGGTTAAYGLASAAAAEGLRVLAIDGDPTAADLTLAAGLAREAPGLLEAAKLDREVDELLQPVDVHPGHKIQVLPAGALTEGDAALTSVAVARIVSAVRPKYDLVVIDSPSAADEYAASVFATHVDAIVVVVRRNSAMAALERLQQVLEVRKSKLVGYVYTFARPASKRR
jgi:Mrp family chromosome partitioning ATPase